MSVHDIQSGDELKPSAPVQVTVTMNDNEWKRLVTPIARVCKSIESGSQVMPITLEDIKGMSDASKIICDAVIKTLTELRDRTLV